MSLLIFLGDDVSLANMMVEQNALRIIHIVSASLRCRHLDRDLRFCTSAAMIPTINARLNWQLGMVMMDSVGI